MGYCTDFKLTLTKTTDWDEEVSPDSEIYKEIRKAFQKVFGEEDTRDFNYFDELVQWGCNWKWYSWEKDMKTIAKLFPDICFTLEGQGEDREDWWIAEFLRNLSCIRRAEIIPPENMAKVWKED